MTDSWRTKLDQDLSAVEVAGMRAAAGEAEQLRAENGRLTAENERLKEDNNGNARGLSYWNRRYVETERQARVDVAAKDRYRAEADSLRAAVAKVRDASKAWQTEEGRESEPPSWRRGCRHVQVAVAAALAGAAPEPEPKEHRWAGGGLDTSWCLDCDVESLTRKAKLPCPGAPAVGVAATEGDPAKYESKHQSWCASNSSAYFGCNCRPPVAAVVQATPEQDKQRPPEWLGYEEPGRDYYADGEDAAARGSDA